MTQKRNRFDNDALSQAQIRKLMEGITKERDRIMILMGFNSGCRVNEIATLRYDKIDFAQNTVTVWDDKHNQWSWKLNKKTGKKVRDQKLNEGKWRKIRMPSIIMQDLKIYIKKYPTKTEYVWTLSWVTWERVLHKWTDRNLGFKKSWHALRHTYMTLSRENGASMEYVMKQTGDTAATILKVYSKITPDALERQAEKPLV